MPLYIPRTERWCFISIILRLPPVKGGLIYRLNRSLFLKLYTHRVNESPLVRVPQGFRICIRTKHALTPVECSPVDTGIRNERIMNEIANCYHSGLPDTSRGRVHIIVV